MTITTRDQLIDAMGNNTSRIVINKNSLANSVAGQLFSVWLATGTPGAGVAPTTAVVPTSATTGALGFTNQTAPVTSYIAWLSVQSNNTASNLEIYDRLAHMGGLSGTVTTAQGALSLVTTDPGVARVGATDYSDVQWYLEIFTDLGATGVNATVIVVYDDASSQTLSAIALGATPRAGRLYPIVSGTAGRNIRSVTSVTLSVSTGTAGNFGITATRTRASLGLLLGNRSETLDWAQLGLPEIPNNSCLAMMFVCPTTATGSIRGTGKIIHG